MMIARERLRRVWLWPAIIFAASGVGLVVALIGNGIWDAAGWLGLLAPVAAIVWARSAR